MEWQPAGGTRASGTTCLSQVNVLEIKLQTSPAPSSRP
eukprot:COSAG02_NODE_31245_length_536_cov_10.382151_1_plen_37_part_01